MHPTQISTIKLLKYLFILSQKSKVKADTKKGIEPISIDEYNKIEVIMKSNTKVSAIINACNDWVIDNHKDFARLPNDNEWQRFLKSPLNEKVGLSFELQ